MDNTVKNMTNEYLDCFNNKLCTTSNKFIKVQQECVVMAIDGLNVNIVKHYMKLQKRSKQLYWKNTIFSKWYMIWASD